MSGLVNSQNTAAVDSGYAWLYLALSVLIGAIGTVGIWAVVVVIPAVQAEFAVDRATASLPYTFTMIGFAFGNVVIGRFVDRLGIRIPLVATGIMLGIGFIASAMTTAIWQFTLIQGLLVGVGGSACFGPLMANISHWFKRRRGIAVALTACGTYLAGAVWPIVMKGFVENEGWHHCRLLRGLRQNTT